jgi:hypothetical protein
MIMVGMLSATLLAFFFPDLWTFRISRYFRPFIAYVLAVAFCSIYDFMKSISSKWYIRINIVSRQVTLGLNKIASISFIGVLLISMYPSLIGPLYKVCLSNTSKPAIADYEYETAAWLKNNMPKSTVIVSDYKTMLYLTSLSDKLCLTNAMEYARELSEEQKHILAWIKYNIFKAPNSQTAFYAIYHLTNLIKFWRSGELFYMNYSGIRVEELTFVIVISSRTVKWLESEADEIHYAQFSKVPSKYLQLFEDVNYFSLVYEIENKIYVFKARPLKNGEVLTIPYLGFADPQAYLEDDWNDDRLTNRVPMSFTLEGIKTFKGRPEWIIVSGSPSVHNGMLILPAGNVSQQRIRTLSEFTTGMWKLDFQFTNVPQKGAFLFIIWAMDGSNQWYVSVSSDAIRLNKVNSGFVSTLIMKNWIADTNWHTLEVTRDNSGNWILYIDGLELGTAKDTFTPIANYLEINNIADQEVHVDNIKLYSF